MRRFARTLVYAGIAAAVVGLSLYHARIVAEPPYSYTGTFRFGWSLVYVALLALTAYGFGLPDVPRTPRQALLASVASSVAAALGISAVQLFVGDSLLPRFVVFGAALVLVPWYLVCTMIANGGVSPGGRSGERALVVGDSVDPTLIREDVLRSAEVPMVVTSVVPPTAVDGTDVGGPTLIDLVERDRATVVVLDRDALASESIVARAAALHEGGVRIRTLPLFYDEWLGMLPISELERTSLMFDIGEVHRVRYGRLKRLVDVGVGLVACLVLLVTIPLVLVGNLVANRGPLLYRQERVGRGGRSFEILKFRSMRSAQPGERSDWTTASDPRITVFGGLLRKTHLDELPQAINILRGELSVVGPRPEQVHYVDALREKLPFYDLRHLVRPGLTGWAQVKYGYAGDERDSMQKLQYEFYYLRHQSLSLDARIIGRTVRSVLRGQGR